MGKIIPEDFLVFLQHWGRSHAAQVKSILVDIGDGSFSVIVCAASSEYDFDLDDQLSDLNLEIVQKFPWCIAEVMQVPGQVKGGHPFLHSAILVYGDGIEA